MTKMASGSSGTSTSTLNAHLRRRQGPITETTRNGSPGESWRCTVEKTEAEADIYQFDHCALNRFRRRRRGKGVGVGIGEGVVQRGEEGRETNTEWMNMGWWTPIDTCTSTGETSRAGQSSADATRSLGKKEFWEANRDLVAHLHTLAGLHPSSEETPTKRRLSILDVGCGYGESVMFALQRYAGRMEKIHGVSIRQEEVERGRCRIEEFLKDTDASTLGQEEVQIFQSDATAFLQMADEGKYDYIFAVDCAYHFPSRSDFFAAAVKRLRRDQEGGGSDKEEEEEEQERQETAGAIGLFDLFRSPTRPIEGNWFHPSDLAPIVDDSSTPAVLAHLLAMIHSALIFLATFLARLSAGSDALVDFQRYHDTTLAAVNQATATEESDGWEVEIWDVTPHVFPHFSDFLQEFSTSPLPTQHSGSLLAIKAQRWGLRLFGRILRVWAEGGRWGSVRAGMVVVRRKTKVRRGA